MWKEEDPGIVETHATENSGLKIDKENSQPQDCQYLLFH